MPDWTPAALPAKLVLIETPAGLGTKATGVHQLRAIAGVNRLLATSNATVSLASDPDTSASADLSVAIPLDELVEVRIAALQQLVATLRGRKPPADPFQLPLARGRRLIEALRALDARLAGATYREIAAALFGPAGVRGSAWKTHDVRDRTIRLARLGERLMRGGYRQLLRYPARARLGQNLS